MMKLILKQKMFSLLDSFDVYSEDGSIAYKVKGELALAHKLKIYSPEGNELGEVSQKIISITPTFELHENGKKIGSIKKKLLKLLRRSRIPYVRQPWILCLKMKQNMRLLQPVMPRIR